MKIKLVLLAFCFILPLSGCQSPVVYSSEPLAESNIYMVEGVENEKIQFIWVELPATLKPGEDDVRLFLAKTDPPEPTIPNPNDLKCTLSENEKVILGPEKTPFEFKENGEFSGSYTYKACPPCIECYMNWDYTLEMTGLIKEETIQLDIAIKHFGLNVQGSYLSTELQLVPGGKQEPRMECDQALVCKEIVFTTRD